MTDAVEEFRSADGRDVLRTGNRLAKASQMVLCSHWPHALPVESLIETLSKVPEASAGGPPLSSSIPEVLLDSYRVGLVEFTTFEPAFHDTAGVHPQASPLVLAQAEEGNRVTSLLHRMVELSEFERLVIRQLDGRRDREEILNILVACTLDGRFPLHQNGQPILDPMAARPILSRSLEPCLKRLAMSALLVG
jgi:methyltransferase-like protein